MTQLTENPHLDAWLAGVLNAPAARVIAAEKLSGGAIQENWSVTIDAGLDGGAGPRRCVIRRDAPATIAASRSRAQEYALIRAAHEAGVKVPTPLGFCADPQVIGAPFALMALVPGTGYGPRLVRDAQLGGDRAALCRELGRQLARIHAIRPDPRLDAILGDRPADPAAAAVALCRDWLDALGTPRPGLEWALRRAQRDAPPPGGITLTHQDYRTGNFLVDARGLTAILDWEFAAWSDPMSDLGWFCARCWRFSRPDREAGGIGDRADFYAGYIDEGGQDIDPARVAWWELMAHLRWAVIALQQGHRHASGEERSLHLALTGRIADTLELDLLHMTAPRMEVR
ncbi:phosphotransferase family protein [Paracoccus spongiarum]|uniref:Phosphotransferase family protein n=1 Tax=Paracoccus spongiarum TaxID=3064387 RepID=A0ABT9JC88_9RHOB|nr:phosphotransferase family protein [Paracoccus sp. 2205BS29-5]MDP5307417.1 phosphotransferase family protein [Paracoccus sp. 2205BS29-5]